MAHKLVHEPSVETGWLATFPHVQQHNKNWERGEWTIIADYHLLQLHIIHYHVTNLPCLYRKYINCINHKCQNSLQFQFWNKYDHSHWYWSSPPVDLCNFFLAPFKLISRDMSEHSLKVSGLQNIVFDNIDPNKYLSPKSFFFFFFWLRKICNSDKWTNMETSFGDILMVECWVEGWNLYSAR